MQGPCWPPRSLCRRRRVQGRLERRPGAGNRGGSRRVVLAQKEPRDGAAWGRDTWPWTWLLSTPPTRRAGAMSAATEGWPDQDTAEGQGRAATPGEPAR